MIMWAWSLTGMIFGILWASMLVDYLGYGRVRRAGATRGCCCAPPPSPARQPSRPLRRAGRETTLSQSHLAPRARYTLASAGVLLAPCWIYLAATQVGARETGPRDPRRRRAPTAKQT
jgi:hypothetical protein